MMPTRRITIRDDDAAYLAKLVDNDWMKIEDHRDDYTYLERKDARFRRQRILQALHLEDNNR